MNLQQNAQGGWVPEPLSVGAAPSLDGALRRPPDRPWAGVGGTMAIVRRHSVGLVLWVALCLSTAVFYLYETPQEFVATTEIVLEPRRPVYSGSDMSAGTLVPSLDSAQADSQIQVVKSERNLRFVFDTLDLKDSPLYAHETTTKLQRLMTSLFGTADQNVGSAAERADRAEAVAFQAFSDRVGVRRLGQSYVLEVSFRAATPAEAARIANSITAAYIHDQIDVRAASVQRGTEFLQGRIADIKTEQDAAADAVKRGVIPDMQFADSDARIVSAALEPLSKTYPQSRLILLLASAFALISGFGVVAVRHSLDRTVRSREQIARDFGVDCIGVLPRLRVRGARRMDRGTFSPTAVLDDPETSFARALRALRAALFASGTRPRRMAVGIVSCSSREGRSAVTSNLAVLLAASTESTLLIDGDVHNPALTRALAPDATFGLTELLMSRISDPRLPQINLTQDLAFVPAVGAGRTADPNVFLGSSEMRQALLRARSERNILVDLPPLSLSSDGQAVGHLLDGVLLLVEVNRTTLDEVSDAIRALQTANVALLGIVLNKASMGGSA